MNRIKTKLIALFLSAVMAVNLLSAVTGVREVKAAGTAADVVAMARSQIGYHEKASNSNLDDFTANSGSGNYTKYARDTGFGNPNAWCAIFVIWCMQKAGVSSSAYPSSAWVPTMQSWFNQRGLYKARGTYTPQPGDIIFLNNTGHVGIVDSVSGSIVKTIEGNTSNDKVESHTFSLSSSYITGYGIVKYSGSSSSSSNTSNPGSPYPIPTGNLKSGSTGDAVRWVQKFANDVMGAGIAVDGIYGNQTINAVRTFQQQNGLTADGIVGTQTTAKMLAVWQNKIASAKPLDLGSEFVALIIRKDIWKTIKNTGSDVVLWDEKSTGDYYWLFKKQGDGTYTIQSLYDGNLLDVQGKSTASGTNVFISAANGGDNQKWYIYASGDAYRLVPKHAQNLSLDVGNAGTANGTNIQVSYSTSNVAQKFALYKVSQGIITKLSINSGYDKTMYVGSKQTLKYSLTPSDTRCNMITWTSSNTSVATVDAGGVVTAKKAGTTTIKCVSTYNKNISASVTITVKDKETPTTEKVTEAPTTEQTTEKATEAPATEKTTETATEASTTEQTTEVSTETPATEQTTEVNYPENSESSPETTTEQNSEFEADETIEKSTESWDDEEEDFDISFDFEDEADKTDKKLPTKGTVLTNSQNKYKVRVTNNEPGNRTVQYVKSTNKNAKKVTIPDKVSFNGVTYKVTSIADNAFCNNKKLTSVTIGSSVKKIGNNAFKNCTKLKSVTIPKAVKEIGKNAFRNCRALKKITIRSTVLKKVGSNALKNIGKNGTLQVPKSKMKAYKKLMKKAGYK